LVYLALQKIRTNKLLEKAQHNFGTKLRDFELKEGEYVSKIWVLQDAIKDKDFKNSVLAREVNESDLKISEQNMKIQELEQSLASKNAIKKEVEDLKEKVRFWKYLNSSLL